ncbi:ParA family protein, partial [Enterococcus hirae]|uniref:ParA family protein n=1 Tax=Enterococcus hirae TaxID=1354 RepID=UPI0013A9F667
FLGWTDDLRTQAALTAPLLGVLLTMADPRTRVTREVTATLHDSGLPVFKATIPRRTAAEDQVGDRLIAGDPGANDDLSAAYIAFTDEVIALTGAARG